MFVQEAEDIGGQVQPQGMHFLSQKYYFEKKDLSLRQDGNSAGLGRKGSVWGLGKPLSLRSPGRPEPQASPGGHPRSASVMAVAPFPDGGATDIIHTL